MFGCLQISGSLEDSVLHLSSFMTSCVCQGRWCLCWQSGRVLSKWSLIVCTCAVVTATHTRGSHTYPHTGLLAHECGPIPACSGHAHSHIFTQAEATQGNAAHDSEKGRDAGSQGDSEGRELGSQERAAAGSAWERGSGEQEEGSPGGPEPRRRGCEIKPRAWTPCCRQRKPLGLSRRQRGANLSALF